MTPYPKKKDTPSRMQRKRARNDVFWKNYTATRKRKSELRRQRREQAE